MIERGVEHRFFVGGAAVDSHSAKGIVPHIERLFTHGGEILAVDFGHKVLLGAFKVDKRYPDFQIHGLTLNGGEFGVEPYMLAGNLVLAGNDFRFGDIFKIRQRIDIIAVTRGPFGNIRAPEPVIGHRFAQTCVEMKLILHFAIAVAPSATVGGAVHPPHQGAVVQHLDMLSGGRAPHTAGKVDLHTRFVVFRKGEMHETATGRGRGFNLYVIVAQAHAVITGTGMLRFLVIGRTVTVDAAILLPGDKFQGAGGRHHQEVA